MDARRIGEVTIELQRGDITAQPDIAAVVNAANARLAPGGGVAGAIHQAAGPRLAAACAPLAPITPGACVMTDAYDLPNTAVLHCLGPVYGHDEPSDALLAACYDRALKIADSHALDSVAFPAISTGIFGYPLPAAAEVAVRTVTARAPQLEHVRRVRFVLWGDEDLRVFRLALEHALG